MAFLLIITVFSIKTPINSLSCRVYPAYKQ